MAPEHCITERFRAQVRAHPDRLAVAGDAGSLTYAELASAATAVAHAVRSCTSGTMQRVVLLADQDTPAVAAILGILEAGDAYVPLDPLLPHVELAALVDFVAAAAIVADRRHAALAERLAAAHRPSICIEACWRATTPGREPSAVAPDSLAYIYFTSGSTGAPKGVCDSHRNVLHNVWRYTVSLAITPADRLSLLQAAHFSGAVSSLFGALLNGASVHPYDVRARGLAGVGPWVRSQAISIYHSVPFIFRQVVSAADFASVRCVRLEGDRATHRDVASFRRHCRPGAILANGLGATECGLVRQWRIGIEAAMPEGPVPIGAAIPDMEVMLLDDDGAAVAAGEVGEIVVRSRYLALGYWRQPELTAARFGVNASDPSLRTYRTGDLGRFAADGSLQYLGRNDGRAKLGGRWIDLDRVERALNEIPDVSDAVAAVRGDDAEPCLAAYLVLRAGARMDPAAFRRALSARLSPSMIPSRWIVLDRLPLQATLKVDRAALPWPPPAQPAEHTAHAGGSDLEEALCELWGEVLGVAAVRPQDDFFALGGDSLAVMRINNRLRARFACDLPAEHYFVHRTVAALADELSRLLRSAR